jgi:hypothetical protein
MNPTTSTFAQPSMQPSGVFFTRGTVLAVNASSGATISFRGQTVVAQQATDEALRVGQDVWVTQARTGEYVICGSVQ